MLPGGVRAVVSDLDGTIVLPGGQLSPATIASVQALRAGKDVIVDAPTGRRPFSAARR